MAWDYGAIKTFNGGCVLRRVGSADLTRHGGWFGDSRRSEGRLCDAANGCADAADAGAVGEEASNRKGRKGFAKGAKTEQ